MLKVIVFLKNLLKLCPSSNIVYNFHNLIGIESFSNIVYSFHNPVGIEFVTDLHLDLSHFREYKLKHGFQDLCCNYDRDLELKVRSCELYNSKYTIFSTQITPKFSHSWPF